MSNPIYIEPIQDILQRLEASLSRGLRRYKKENSVYFEKGEFLVHAILGSEQQIKDNLEAAHALKNNIIWLKTTIENAKEQNEKISIHTIAHSLTEILDKIAFKRDQENYELVADIFSDRNKNLGLLEDLERACNNVRTAANMPDLKNSEKEARDEQVKKALDALEEVRPIDLDSYKTSLRVELEKYINSRGTVDKEGVFKPSLTTRLFRNSVLTEKKVEVAKKLIRNIVKAESLDNLYAAVNAVKNHPTEKELIKHGFLSTMAHCTIINQRASEAIGPKERPLKNPSVPRP